ncbi:MAG: hypothetical protein ABWZ67_14385 [Solirubrobacteraceae bacterium]
MSNPAARHRPSLSFTVLRVATVAAVSAVLIWSVLFVDLVRKHSDAAAALSPPVGQIANPDRGQPAQAPAPVTTRTS